ncbi:MAG: hypothetical protein PHV99_03145 [Candidatus Pacebacteria bacterium]|nr:hypothetical protein [Candidatus Paceibacterota bacterium]
MLKNHGIAYQWKIQQLGELTSRILRSIPQALTRHLRGNDQDPKRVLKFTSDPERLELALAEAIRMLLNGHACTMPSETLLFLDRQELHHEFDLRIWRGSFAGTGLEGEPAENQESLELERIDFKRVWMQTGHDRSSTGLARLDPANWPGMIPLDAHIAHVLFWKDNLRVLMWLFKQFGWLREVYFPGSVFIINGLPCVKGIQYDRGAEVFSWCEKSIKELFHPHQAFLYVRA